MSYKVYKIDTFPVKDNSYCVGREESWTLKLDTTFTDYEEAKNYVRIKNRMNTELPLFLVDVKTQEEKDNIVDEFCFGEKYIQYQRFFLGKPDVNKIKIALREQGIIVKK